MERPTPIKDAAVHRLAKSITQLTLCQVTTSEVDDATKLLEKARQKLQGIQNIPSQRVNVNIWDWTVRAPSCCTLGLDHFAPLFGTIAHWMQLR